MNGQGHREGAEGPLLLQMEPRKKGSQAPEDPGIQEAMTETREQAQIKLRWQESLLIWTHLGYLAVCLIII